MTKTSMKPLKGKRTGPMEQEDIDRAKDLLQEIGEHKKEGFYLVIHQERLGDGLSQATGISKVTDSNPVFIIATMMTALKLEPDHLRDFLKRIDSGDLHSSTVLTEPEDGKE